MRFVTTLLLSAVVPMIACSGDPEETEPASDAERLFATASAPATNKSRLEGVWETKKPRLQPGLESMIRLELRSDRVSAAARCTPAKGDVVVVGDAGPAAVTDAAIEIPEDVTASKSIGTGYCGVRLVATKLAACDMKKLPNDRKQCFELSDGTLIVRESVAATEYVKVAD